MKIWVQIPVPPESLPASKSEIFTICSLGWPLRKLCILRIKTEVTMTISICEDFTESSDFTNSQQGYRCFE